MSQNLYVFTALLIAATCILIFGVRAFAAVQSARTREAREAAYRDLVAKATAVQGDTAARLASLQSELAALSTRLASIEKMLRSVE